MMNPKFLMFIFKLIIISSQNKIYLMKKKFQLIFEKLLKKVIL